MILTTGEDAEWYVLDEKLVPVKQPMPEPIHQHGSNPSPSA